MKSILLIFLCISLQTIVKCEKCPRVEAMRGFDVKKFTGNWYVIESDPENPDEDDDDDVDNWKCGVETLTLSGSRTLKGEFTFVNLTTNATDKDSYTITLRKDTDTAVFKADVVFETEKFSFDLLLLDTDYENYSVFWLCFPLDDGTDSIFRVATIESRKPVLATEHLRKAYDVLDGYHLDRSNMRKIVHDC